MFEYVQKFVGRSPSTVFDSLQRSFVIINNIRCRCFREVVCVATRFKVIYYELWALAHMGICVKRIVVFNHLRQLYSEDRLTLKTVIIHEGQGKSVCTQTIVIRKFQWHKMHDNVWKTDVLASLIIDITQLQFYFPIKDSKHILNSLFAAYKIVRHD